MIAPRKNLSSRSLARLAGAVLLALAVAVVMTQTSRMYAAEPTTAIPAPTVDATAPGDGPETAVVAGGCFWGVQAVFAHVKGVTLALSGYAGGTTVDPRYTEVTTGTT